MPTTENRIHTCAGIYPDMSYQVNYVRDTDLAGNIEYNRTFRPGRYYFVDGRYACGGILKEPEKSAMVARLESYLASLAIPDRTTDSRPYL